MASHLRPIEPILLQISIVCSASPDKRKAMHAIGELEGANRKDVVIVIVRSYIRNYRSKIRTPQGSSHPLHESEIGGTRHADLSRTPLLISDPFQRIFHVLAFEASLLPVCMPVEIRDSVRVVSAATVDSHKRIPARDEVLGSLNRK